MIFSKNGTEKNDYIYCVRVRVRARDKTIEKKAKGKIVRFYIENTRYWGLKKS